MRFRARLAADKLTLLSRCGTASRTTDSERVSWAGVVLLHGGKWKRSTRVVSSSVRQRTPFGGLARSRFLAEFVPTFLRRFTLGQSLKSRLKMRTPFIQSFASHASASSRVLKMGNSRGRSLEQRGLISPGKGRDPLTIVWRLKRKQNKATSAVATALGCTNQFCGLWIFVSEGVGSKASQEFLGCWGLCNETPAILSWCYRLGFNH
jgi:hypothetical protein